LCSELCIPDCVLTLAAALMDFLDPVGRFADAAAAPVERCNAHVACLRLPLAIWWRAAAEPAIVDVFDV